MKIIFCIRHSLRLIVTFSLSLLLLGAGLGLILAQAPEPYLVKDIHPNATGSSIYRLTAMNGVLYFTVNDDLSGRELWKSDGTLTGTMIVSDINPGDGSSHPSALTVVSNTLYFHAYDEIHGRELWKSNGTVTGTRLISDINPGGSGIEDHFEIGSSLAELNGRILFEGYDGASNMGLWQSDGTPEGTALIRNIPGDMLFNLTKVNNQVFFITLTYSNGWKLWKSDGTEAGTTVVLNVSPGSYPPYRGMTAVNDKLFFCADDGIHGSEPWVSDGTIMGTTIISDLNPFSDCNTSSERGKGSSPCSSCRYHSGFFNTAVMNDTFFFTADDGRNGWELWQSDGTATGTTMVKHINTLETCGEPAGVGTGSSACSSLYWDYTFLTPINGTLFFNASDGVNGFELWKSDGTEEGTVMVKDIRAGGGSSPEKLTGVNGMLFFSASNGISGRELWQSNGTAAGTKMVKDINPAGSSEPYGLIDVDGNLFFIADDGTHGEELWAYDVPTIAIEAVYLPILIKN